MEDPWEEEDGSRFMRQARYEERMEEQFSESHMEGLQSASPFFLSLVSVPPPLSLSRPPPSDVFFPQARLVQTAPRTETFTTVCWVSLAR